MGRSQGFSFPILHNCKAPEYRIQVLPRVFFTAHCCCRAPQRPPAGGHRGGCPGLGPHQAPLTPIRAQGGLRVRLEDRGLHTQEVETEPPAGHPPRCSGGCVAGDIWKDRDMQIKGHVQGGQRLTRPCCVRGPGFRPLTDSPVTPERGCHRWDPLEGRPQRHPMGAAQRGVGP